MKLSLLSVFFISLISVSVSAHEMWIQPLQFSSKLDDKILANEVIGQNFKGNNYAYLPKSFSRLNISLGNTTRAITSRLGDLPAIQETSLGEGLHVITAETPLSELVYTDPQVFLNFLKIDGLPWVLAEHKKRGLPDSGFKEVYRRSPKALIKVGHGKGQDRAFGLPLEWVVKTNPYTSKGDIHAQLLWQGKPAANMYVNVFNKPNKNSKDSELIKSAFYTDANGNVVIPRAKGGLFLVNSVKMVVPDEETMQSTKAVWETIWGSLTYEILDNN